jgi:hypothetical protein
MDFEAGFSMPVLAGSEAAAHNREGRKMTGGYPQESKGEGYPVKGVSGMETMRTGSDHNDHVSAHAAHADKSEHHARHHAATHTSEHDGAHQYTDHKDVATAAHEAHKVGKPISEIVGMPVRGE